MSKLSAHIDARPSAIAGTWYPGSAGPLAQAVDQYIADAQVSAVAGTVIGIMAPHAGYRYSGAVAGHAYRFVQGRATDTVAVISPLHRRLAVAPVFTTAHHAYRTPLGDIPVDHAALDALRAEGVNIAAIRHDDEHSLEIQLPFLQRTLDGGFTLIPLMLSDQTAQCAAKLGDALAKTLQGKRALLVASTDLSHFYDQQSAHRFDGVFLNRVAAFDPEGVVKVEDEGKAFACGRGAVAAVMWAARTLGADAAAVMNYATSGDVSGDLQRVVGYGAAVFYQRTPGA